FLSRRYVFWFIADFMMAIDFLMKNNLKDPLFCVAIRKTDTGKRYFATRRTVNNYLNCGVK
ncbi:hypothetical protein, partial [Mixta calida]|uniref:hypothetical protein n=1 Tax=Mixta calida TaxID=665913 RepID=UPI002896E4D2